MSRGLADTSIFIARESGRAMKLDLIPDELGVSVITVGELRAGVLAASTTAVRDRRLSTLSAALVLNPILISEQVAHSWARLRILLRDSGLRMTINDSWVAATAMALEVPVVTQGEGFTELDSLRVIQV